MGIFKPSDLVDRIKQIKALETEVKIVFTNGCFDVLHRGHLSLLETSKLMGLLVVALNSDQSIQKIKSNTIPPRPIFKLRDRLEMIDAFKFVDFVTWFEEETPLELIKQIQPHYLIKGGDYYGQEIVGHKEVLSWGGQVMLVPFEKGYSSSSIIDRIRANPDTKNSCDNPITT